MPGTTDQFRSGSSYFTEWKKLPVITEAKEGPFIPLIDNEAGNNSSISVLAMPPASTFTDLDSYEPTASDTLNVELFMVLKIENKTVFSKIAEQEVTLGVPFTFTGLRADYYVIKGASSTVDLYVSYENNPVNKSNVGIPQTEPFKPWDSVMTSPMQVKVINPNIDYSVNPLGLENTNGSIHI